MHEAWYGPVFVRVGRQDVLIVDHQQYWQAQFMGDLRRVFEAMIEELTHVDQGNRQQQTGEQAERDDQERLGKRRVSRLIWRAEYPGVGQVVVQRTGGAAFGKALGIRGERRVQGVDLGVHLPQLALGFL